MSFLKYVFLISSLLFGSVALVRAVDFLDVEASHGLAQFFSVENGEITQSGEGDDALLTWRIPAGQSSKLTVPEGAPFFKTMRNYEIIDFEFRIVEGEINNLDLYALGQVTGIRQYKMHNWQFGIRTVEKNVWHRKQLKLNQPNWLPWDNKDGQGSELFYFESLALAPDAVIEIRRVKFLNAGIALKPDFERPITWPKLTRHADGSADYSMVFQVMNTSGQPIDIQGKILNAPEHFRPSFVESVESGQSDPGQSQGDLTYHAKNGEIVSFNLQAHLTAQEAAKMMSLEAEPLQISFSSSAQPQQPLIWQGLLVRPLEETLKKQVVYSETDLQAIRDGIAAGNEDLIQALGLPQILRFADEFLDTELLAFPDGTNHPGGSIKSPWKRTKRMPEIRNEETGEVQFGTDLASKIWKTHLRFKVYENLGKAYLFTGDERYAEKATELAMCIVKAYPSMPWARTLFDTRWEVAAPILSSSRIAASSGYGTNMWLRNFCIMVSMVSPSQAWAGIDVQRVRDDFLAPYATELMKFSAPISNMADITNHNLLLLGLVFEDATMVRYALLSDAGLMKRITDIDAEGFSSEGRPVNYQLVGMDEYLPALGFLSNAGLSIAFDKERLVKALKMPFQRALLSGAIPSSGDAGRGPIARGNRLADVALNWFPEDEALWKIGAAPWRQVLMEKSVDRFAWRSLFETKPRLYKDAGFVILRSGETLEEQVMVTLDYGRNVFHNAMDRNQITLSAFGAVLSQGAGSLYNVGSGDVVKTNHHKLKSWVGHASAAVNVIVVDGQNQQPCIGQLQYFSDQPDYQVAVAVTDGVQPGVSHRRGVVLSEGVVVVLDQMMSEQVHTYDFIYHNYGSLTIGESYQAIPRPQVLGRTGNYENFMDLQTLTGEGPLSLTWDNATVSTYDGGEILQPVRAGVPVKLRLWHPVTGEAYTAVTASNNAQTGLMPEATPSLIHRIKGKTATFATVLEPFKSESRVKQVEFISSTEVQVHLKDGRSITVDSAHW